MAKFAKIDYRVYNTPMGSFLERLRRKNQQEEVEARRAVTREAVSILEARRGQQAEGKRISRERAENEPQWEEAKMQFGESGLLAIFQKVIDLKGAGSYGVDPENFDKISSWKKSVGHPYFYAELHIKTIVKEHDRDYFTGEYLNKITTEYVGVETDKDGTISFRGKRGPLSLVVKVPKTKWQGNVKVLENALGKVYRYPLTAERHEIIKKSLF